MFGVNRAIFTRQLRGATLQLELTYRKENVVRALRPLATCASVRCPNCPLIRKRQRQTTPKILQQQKQWTLTEPVHVQVHAKESMPPCLSHFYVVCPPEQKLAVLRALVRRELGVSAAATAVGPEAMSNRVGGAAEAVADTRGLVFALATKPLEGIATSLDKALGGGSGEGTEGGGGRQQTKKGRGGQGAPAPLAEFLREELGLNARVRIGQEREREGNRQMERGQRTRGLPTGCVSRARY